MFKLGLRVRAYGILALSASNAFSIRPNDFGNNSRNGSVGKLVQNGCLNMNFRVTFRHVVVELAVNEDPVRRDGDRRGFHQPDVAVNSRALVKPAFRFGGIHFHGDHVFPAAIRHVGDVIAEAAVTAFVVADEPAVDKNFAVAERAVEFQPEPFAGIFFWQFKGAAIPRHAVGGKSVAQRLEPVRAVRGFIEGQLHRPIVRQIHRAPARVAEPDAGRAAAGAGLGQVLGDAPVVAEMKFPVGVEQQPFARAGGGGGEQIQARGGEQEVDRQKDTERFGFHGEAG